MYLNKLKDIVNHYDKFKQIAIGLEWIKINASYFDWYNKYPAGIYIYLYEFPIDYIRNHFAQAFVRARLSNMAYDEEWEADFWDISENECHHYVCGMWHLGLRK